MPKILAIDDINDNLISLKAIIADAFPGADVFTALNGAKGIELAIANDPDVILLDIIMPGMDGFEVCRRLKADERVRDIPVVFITAIKGDKESRIKALEVGAEGFLTKPIDEPELIAQIRAMVKIKEAGVQKRNENERLKTLIEERTKTLNNELRERKRTEEILRESEELFKHVFESANVGKSMTLPSGELNVNQAFCTMLGYTDAELKEKKWQDITPPEDVKRVEGLIGELLDGKKNAVRFIKRYLHKNGSIVWADVSATLLRDGNGKPIHFITTIIDISDQVRAEESLRRNEENMRALLNGIPESVFLMEFDGRVIAANSTVAERLKCSLEDLINKNIYNLLSPEVANLRIKLVEKAVQTKRYVQFEDERAGRIIDNRIHPVIDQQGNVNRFAIIGIDITESKRNEASLKESEEKYRRMVDLLPDAVIIHAEGNIVFANSATYSLLGATSSDQVIGKPALDFVHPDSRIHAYGRIKKIYETGEPSGFAEEKFITLNNEVLDAEVIGIPVNYMGKPAIQTIARNITDRKRAEDALWESQLNFKALFEKGPIGVAYHRMIYNEAGKPVDYLFLDANQSYQRLTGVNPVGKLVTEAFPGIENSSFDWIATYGEVAKNGKEIRFQQYLETNKRWYDCVGYQYRPDHFVAAFFEITEQKLAEEKMSSIFRVAPTGIGVVADRVLMEVNPRITEMTGFSKEELIGQNSLMLYPTQEEFDYVGREKYSQISIKGTGVVETRWQKKDGSIIHVLIASTPIHRSDISKGVIFTALDITERKQAELALSESSELNNTLLQTIPFGMNIVDEEGNILFQNENMIRLFGASPVQSKCWELYRDDKRQCHDCPLLSGIRIGETDMYETQGVLGGRTFQISHTGMLFHGKKAMLEIFQDITERKNMEKEIVEAKEKAEESDRLKSAFLANMSHEIRTPLNSIIGFAELMTDPDFDNDQQFEFARMIHTSGVNLLSIISDIMDLSKIEAGQVHVNRNTFSVNQLVSKIQREYSFEAAAKNIELRIAQGMWDEILLKSDEPKLRQVLVNFVGNALKFTRTGYIEIGAEEVNGMVRFHVKDTGIGIPAKYHEQIFERFRQVEASETRKYGGNGLGLAISKSLVELLGGKIWMESEEGKGSIFYFAIPHLA